LVAEDALTILTMVFGDELRMSDTPRTDAAIEAGNLADTSRELERELNQRNQACDDYAATIYRLENPVLKN
jgi:hypothetical protein